jgi:very-short-patch-repair endonuclease
MNILGIELDGHAFHEKTKDQAEKDKARERDLMAMGWTLLRFTGREVWRDPFVILDDIGDQFFFMLKDRGIL